MPNPLPKYHTLPEALLVILCARWTQADELVADLLDFDGAKRIAFRWTPGQVLDELERLAVAGKVEHDKGRGWRLMAERVLDSQRGLFT